MTGFVLEGVTALIFPQTRQVSAMIIQRLINTQTYRFVLEGVTAFPQTRQVLAMLDRKSVV